MNPIRFRAWDKRKKEMGKVVAMDWDCYDNIITAHIEYYDGKVRKVYPNDDYGDEIVFMQDTGLKDKNGKDIYEGDIIEITGTYKPGRYEVIWDDYRVAWWGNNIKVRDREYDDDFFQLLGAWQQPITEVIGNIYEKFGQLNLLEVEE